jgi:hypothetical protein
VNQMVPVVALYLSWVNEVELQFCLSFYSDPNCLLR